MTDILDEMTKQELIDWIRKSVPFKRPSRADVLLIRWEKAGKQLRADYQAELDHWERTRPDFAERDRLAKMFNESSDTNERLSILKKMKPYDDALAAHMARCKALDKRQEQVDQLYKQSEAESDKERQQGGES
jgi:hypothetical protein